MKILIRVPNWLGDAILSIPALQALSTLGGGGVTVVVHERVRELFEGLPGVNRVLPFERGIPFWLKRRLEQYDLGVLFPLSFSSAFLLAMSGTKERVGYKTEGRGVFLTHPLPLPKDYRKRHLVETYLQLARSLNGGEERKKNIEYRISNFEVQFEEPLIPIHPQDEDKANLFLRGAEHLIGIGSEAVYGPAKRWEKFPELEKRLKEYGNVVLLGSVSPASSIQHPASKIIDLRGKTTLKETAAILKQCRIFITNDTGLGHLAAAVGTPVLSIFGSTSPEWTRPLGSRNRVLYKNLWCSPCFARTCRFGTYACLEEISVEEVLKAVEEMIGICAE